MWVFAGLILILFVSIPILSNNNSGTKNSETVKLTQGTINAVKLLKMQEIMSRVRDH